MRNNRKPRRPLLAAAVLATLAAPAAAVDYVWSSGDYVSGVTSSNPLLASDTLTIGSGGTKRFVGGSFTSHGSVTWLSDQVQGGNSGTVTNTGTWDLRSDSPTLVWQFGGQPTFTNAGTYRKSAGTGAAQFGSWAFVNDGGLVDVQTGTLAFSGGNNRFLANSRFSGAGSTLLTGTAFFSGSFFADNLVLAGGTANGTAAQLSGGVAQAAGTMAWSGGDLSGSWTVASGSSLNATSGLTKRQVGGNLTNNGTWRWQTADGLQLGNSSTIDNNGVFDAQASATLVWQFGGQPTLSNSASATLRASNGATLTIGAVSLVSNGALMDATAGSAIVYAGGSARFNDGTRFAGSHNVSSSARFVDSIASDGGLVFSGGTQTGGDGVTPGSLATLAGNLGWTGGDISGSWVMAAGTTVTASGVAGKRQVGGSIVNNGSWVWDTTAALQTGNSSTITNNGSFGATATATVAWSYGGQSTLTNSATGSVYAGNGATLTIGSIRLVSDGGLFTASAGSGIVYNGGSARFNNGTRFSGAGTHTVSGNATFVDAIDTTTGNLAFSVGSQTGGDGTPGSRATLTGPLAWQGGDLLGGWTVAAGSSVNASSAASKRQVGGDVVNNGNWLWVSSASFDMGNSSSFTNNGVFEAQSSTALNWGFGGRPTVTNSASGTLRVNNGAVLTVGAVSLVSDGGLFQASAGTINYSGGAARFNHGTRFSGAGNHAFNSDARFVGSINTSAGNVRLAGGGHSGGDGTAGSSATLVGGLAWTGGDLRENWVIAAASTVTGGSGGSKRQTGGTLVNNGTLSWQTTDVLQTGNSSSLTNNGTFDIAADASVAWSFGGQSTLVNNGLLVKSAGAGTGSLASQQLQNNGTLDVRSGTLALPANFNNAGTLTGGGSFSAGGSVSNAGHVAPGTGVGTLTVAANFVQSAAGFFDVEVTSLLSHDLLEVIGNATLGGTLAVMCVGNCVLQVGDEIEVLDYTGSRGGTFASLTLDGFAGGAFIPIYDDTNTRVLLRVTQMTTPVPEPATWATLLAGLLGLAAAVRRRSYRM